MYALKVYLLGICKIMATKRKVYVFGVKYVWRNLLLHKFSGLYPFLKKKKENVSSDSTNPHASRIVGPGGPAVTYCTVSSIK